jgi:hypothetical protein
LGLARRLGIQPQRRLCFKLGPRERNSEATLAALPKKKWLRPAQKICSFRGRGLKHSLLRTLQQQKFKELQLQSFGGAGERHPQLQRSGLARHTASLLNARISKHALCRIPGCKKTFFWGAVGMFFCYWKSTTIDKNTCFHD